MSQKLRITTIEELIAGGLSAREATEKLGVHRTTLWRLVQKYREKGQEGLKHGLKGRRSNRAKPDAFKQEICDLYEREYRPKGISVHAFYHEIARTLPNYTCYATVLSWLRPEAGAEK